MERIEWSRDSACGSGATCPRLGYRPERDTVLVVGKIVQEQHLIAQAGVGPGEVLTEVPAWLLPEVR